MNEPDDRWQDWYDRGHEARYRYTATPNSHWQSYMKAPIVDAEEVCEHCWMDRPSQGLPAVQTDVCTASHSITAHKGADREV